MTEVLFTSAEWNEKLKDEIYVMDPDGWPRSDAAAFEQEWYRNKINKSEFMRRALFSTCCRRTGSL